jgi:hypothetical protein
MRDAFFHSMRCQWLVLALVVIGLACNKHDFLDKKPSTNLLIPMTLSDFQALLDNVKVFGLVPVLGEASADNYYVSYTAWQTMVARELNAYVWTSDIFGGQGGQLDWNIPYQQVFYANVVLDGLKTMKKSPDSTAMWNTLEGSALFCRAFAFYNLAQLFAPVYDEGSASSDLGIPLRTSSAIDTLSARASVRATYDQILSDLHQAESYLPAGLPGRTLNRPVRLCAEALLARVYLSMRNYALARLSADSVLREYSTLMDYDTLNTASAFPVNLFNAETLYQASFLGAPSSTPYFSAISAGYPTTSIDSNLIRSYDTNDLRLQVFYRTRNSGSTFYLKGGYTGTIYPFGGLAVDELFLIRAEGAANAGDAGAAIADVNTLLRKRWKTGTFNGYTVASAKEALDTVRLERRKELAFRGLRWTDLRRLNKEGANIILSHILFDGTNAKSYTLAPNDINYTLPIPPDVMNLNGSIQQNTRH